MNIEILHSGNPDPIVYTLMTAIALKPETLLGAAFFNQNNRSEEDAQIDTIEGLEQHWIESRKLGVSGKYYGCILISAPMDDPLSPKYTFFSFRYPLEIIGKWAERCPQLPVALDWVSLPKGVNRVSDCHDLKKEDWAEWADSRGLQETLITLCLRGLRRRSRQAGIEADVQAPSMDWALERETTEE